MSGLAFAVAACRWQYETRTAGGAHLYRVTQHYDSWPPGHDPRVSHGSRSRRRPGTFRTLEPAVQRPARANGCARYQQPTGGAAMLFTEDEGGRLTRLRIPGPGFLRLTGDAAGKLARSRPQPDKPGEPGDPSPASPGKEPGRP